MANAGEDNPRKKEREPITFLCSIILLVACVLVIGNAVYDNYIAVDDKTIDTGDKVTLNYTGAYYDYYDEGGMIFQTTVESVDKSAEYDHSPGYSYASGTISMTVGAGSYLADFEDAVRGHKVGDTVKVKIDAENAYWLGGYWSSIYTQKSLTVTSNLSVSYSVSGFQTMYADQAYGVEFESKLGIPAIATLNSQEGKVVVTYYPKSGETYEYDDVEYKVTSVTESDFTYTIDADFEKTGNTVKLDDGTSFEEVKMVNINGELVCGINGDNYVVKNTKETNNIDIYFTIQIVSA